MSNKLALSLLLSLGGVVACQQDTTAPSAVVPAPRFAAQSGGVEINVVVPLSQTNFVPCANGGAGEDVQLSGNLHVVINQTIDSRGGIHYKEHFQPAGATGLGLTTGDTYRATGATQLELNLNKGEEITAINNFRLIGPGPGNNLLVHTTLHITVNANGDLTVVHDFTSVECR